MGMFKPATRQKLKLRMAIAGPAGAGKTYTATRQAFALAGPNGRVAVIDSEHRSASKYIGESPDGFPWKFDVVELEHFAPTTYTAAIKEAVRCGYDVLIIDGLSPAWDGIGGALDQVDKAQDKGGGKFAAWKDVTPQHRELVDTILAAPIHIIATLRSKMGYEMEKDEKGKTVVKKVGLSPIQRDGMEYEFDVFCDMDVNNLLTVAKTRCSPIRGQRVSLPGPAFMEPIKRWLETGDDAAPAFVPAEKPAEKPTEKGIKLDATPADSGDQHSARLTEKCGQAQREEIIALAKAIKMPAQALIDIIRKRGFQSVADLPVGDAIALIAKLKEKKSKMEADSLFDGQYPANSPTAS
jgi:hypothetical protein